jgi:hypothetical protein
MRGRFMAGDRDNKGRSKPGAKPPHYHGHRERLRARFLGGGGTAGTDCELINQASMGHQLQIPAQLERDEMKDYGLVTTERTLVVGRDLADEFKANSCFINSRT